MLTNDNNLEIKGESSRSQMKLLGYRLLNPISTVTLKGTLVGIALSFNILISFLVIASEGAPEVILFKYETFSQTEKNIDFEKHLYSIAADPSKKVYLGISYDDMPISDMPISDMPGVELVEIDYQKMRELKFRDLNYSYYEVKVNHEELLPFISYADVVDEEFTQLAAERSQFFMSCSTLPNIKGMSFVPIYHFNDKVTLYLSKFFPDLPEFFTVLNDDLVYLKKSEDMYLVMEKLNASNVQIWKDFAFDYASGKKLGFTDKVFIPKQFEHLKKKAKDVLTGAGITGFEATLRLIPDSVKNWYDHKSNWYNRKELWVAYVYASKEEPKEISERENIEDFYKKIEMFVSVITAPESLHSSHMGISRNIYHMAAEDAINHPNISLKLHAFAAHFIKSRFPRKKYMITSPVPSMRNILDKSLKGDIFDVTFIEDDHLKFKDSSGEKELDCRGFGGVGFGNSCVTDPLHEPIGVSLEKLSELLAD